MSQKTYGEKLRDPRWQQVRLKVMERDGWKCRRCWNKDDTLNVHHSFYQKGLDPWEYPQSSLSTLCEVCHKEVHHILDTLHREIAAFHPAHLHKVRVVSHPLPRFTQDKEVRPIYHFLANTEMGTEACSVEFCSRECHNLHFEGEPRWEEGYRSKILVVPMWSESGRGVCLKLEECKGNMTVWVENEIRPRPVQPETLEPAP